MPPKPTRMATARRQPIHSPSIGPASSATVSGVRKPTVVVWSSLQMLEREKIESRRAEQQERAGDLRLEFLGAQQARYGDEAQDRDHGQELAEKPHPYNLSRR